ncbi:DUF4214 domain-containing protein [Pseudoduganella albidiflava]|uniref:DUF4214 domain-containing protein n=1 Tax=Pseudoduganella albidiflava TaxID=321983 RepID=A0A411WUX4_9BURK|nr:Ig-like domain-containing protein [Pseudoduganella albidiflava]QBI00422.1 DUF4214 domain-containing protein [Pseudoduganella albidiflava]GGY53773.1 hypothetical protein GCM10007387_40310 [Pseudoduganella albidiflava]
MPSTFDFTANVIADTDPNAGPGITTATQTVDGHTLRLVGDSGGWVVMSENDFLGGDLQRLHGQALFKEFNDIATKLRLSLDGNKLFDLTSLNLVDIVANSGGQFRFTTAKGVVDSGPLDSEWSVSFFSNSPILAGIAWVDITMVDPAHQFIPAIDDIVLSNITSPNVAPAFVGAGTTMSAVQNGGAVNLAGLLHASDTDSGQTLTWSQSAGPAHGTLSISGATAASGSTDITPGGTLGYTPAAGYAGTDSFTVQVSDGIATSSRTITVSVAPLPPGAPDLASASDTGASASDNVTAANSMTFSGTSAPGDIASTVRVFIDVNDNGAYNAGEATGTATVSNGAWTVAGVDTSGLGTGSYNVRAVVTSATGGLSSGAGSALAITVDRTPPAMTFSGVTLSADTGVPGDAVTNTAAQTITATLTSALAATDTVRGSLDNGATWTTLTGMVSGTTLAWTGATLVASGGIRLQVLDEHGNAGTTTSQAYALDVTPPAQTVALAALSADSGAGGDFVTNTAAQTLSGTLSGNTAAGDVVEVSLNNGASWTMASHAAGTSTWSLPAQILAASGILQVRVTDAAGNPGTAYTHAYLVDSAAPTATTPASSSLVAPTGSAWTVTVTYADTGGAGIDTATIGTGNIGVTGPQGGALAVTGFAVNGNQVTYTVAAPGGGWGPEDAGAYTVAIHGGVADVAGNAVAANASAETVDVVFSTAPAVSQLALSADTGTSNSDFITHIASQTVTATLGIGLAAGDRLWGSLDNGQTWADITHTVSGTGVQWSGVTLAGSNTLVVRATDSNGQPGTAASHAYTLDTAAPAQGFDDVALSADTGASGTDFVTATALQNIGGVLNGAAGQGEFVEVSLDNGASWAPATTSGSTWSLHGITLPASGTLQVRVADVAGNHGSPAVRAYLVDTLAPTAAMPATTDLAGPTGGTFEFTVTYADTGGAGLDTATLGTGNVAVAGPHGNPVTVTAFSVDGNAVTYTAQAPGGSWDAGDAGAYTVAVNGASVRDMAGNTVAADPAAGTITVGYRTPPAASVLRLGSDTGISDTDFITSVAAQTIHATLDKALAASDTAWGSLDNGQSWTNITAKVSGTAVAWDGVSLAGAGTVVVKVTDGVGQDGAAASHAYVLDTAAPARTVATVALSADTGASSTDFITQTAGQDLSGTLDGALADGEFVEVSLDDGATWAVASASGTGWTLQGATLAAMGVLQVRVSDTAGNHAAPWTQAYVVDTAAPVAAPPVRADLDASGASFTFTVAYADAGGAGLDPATFGTGNVAVTGAAGALAVSGYSVAGGTVTYTVDAPGGSWDTNELGDYTIGIAANSVRDLAGNAVAANPAAHMFHVGTTLRATLAIADTALTAGETTTMTVTFTRAVQDLDVADFTVPNGSLAALATADGGLTWTATLTPDGDAWANANVVTLNLALVHGPDGIAGTGTAESNAYAVRTGSEPGGEVPPPPPPPGAVDGVPVTVTQQEDPATGLVNNVVTVPTVTATRNEDPGTPNAALADIPLTASRGGSGSALTVSLPVGAGLDVSGAASLLTGDDALRDLIHRIEQKTAAGSGVREEMTAEGTAFLEGLLGDVLLQTATVTPTALDDGTARTILIGGSTVPGTPADAAARGIVIDARQLPDSVTLQLDDVHFAAVVGAATLRGGAGQNIVIGDSAGQDIFLGEEDDQLLGGGGDDVLGSAGGNDLLSGGDGNDAAAGGTGNDSVAGGSGDDVLQGGRSDRGAWTFTLAANGTVTAIHQTRMFAATASETLAAAELDADAGALAFLATPAERLLDIALLYQGAFGRAADLEGLNFHAVHAGSAIQVAQSFTVSEEWAGSVLNVAGDTDYVEALYRQVLGRAADAEGMAFWTGAMAGTHGAAASRAEVLLGFTGSAEHRGQHAGSIVLGTADVAAEQGWIGGSGDDRLEAGAGNDWLAGGDGSDTAVFAGALADYGMLVTGGGKAVLTSTAHGADTISGIEWGEFADGGLDLSFAQDPHAVTAGLLYQAVLDRAADLPGIAWWSAHGGTASQMAAGFVDSAEFQASYGALDDRAFVDALYANSALGDGMAGGAAAWVDYLREHTRAELVGAWIGHEAVVAAHLTTAGL